MFCPAQELFVGNSSCAVQIYLIRSYNNGPNIIGNNVYFLYFFNVNQLDLHYNCQALMTQFDIINCCCSFWLLYPTIPVSCCMYFHQIVWSLIHNVLNTGKLPRVLGRQPDRRIKIACNRQLLLSRVGFISSVFILAQFSKRTTSNSLTHLLSTSFENDLSYWSKRANSAAP